MKVPILLFLFITLLSSSLHSQTKPIATEIVAKNVFNLSIIDLFPDSFPKVSVVFQAKNSLNEPLWLLQKNELRVTENYEDCEVLDLFNISQNKPFNIALVLDRSGSMRSESYEFKAVKRGQRPIDYAKKGILAFLDGQEVLDDPILFVSFSTVVDKVLPLTTDGRQLEQTVKNIRSQGLTAFYDGLYQAIDTLSVYDAEPAIIGLTDGHDNTSQHTYEEVIQYAKEKNIPIYIIGLGSVDSMHLGNMAEQTKGLYYHTNNADALVEVYQNIKKQLKSIYQVDYRSNNLNATDTTRDLAFHFVNDTLSFANNATPLELPIEAIEYLEEQAEIRAANTAFRQRMIGGSIGLIVLLGIGAFAIRRSKKKKKGETPIIKKHYPNPVVDILIIELDRASIRTGILRILNSSGVGVKEISLNLSKLQHQIDISNLESGWYVLQIQTTQGPSNTIKVLKQ
ncbi:MAG: VWA domain-containing protein [Aureispira sp.]|nr:VWA domain-containing protein [Aureispira sp.]